MPRGAPQWRQLIGVEEGAPSAHSKVMPSPSQTRQTIANPCGCLTGIMSDDLPLLSCSKSAARERSPITSSPNFQPCDLACWPSFTRDPASKKPTAKRLRRENRASHTSRVRLQQGRSRRSAGFSAWIVIHLGRAILKSLPSHHSVVAQRESGSKTMSIANRTRCNANRLLQ